LLACLLLPGNGLLLGKTLLSLVIIIPFFILFTLGCLYVTNFICELRVSGGWSTMSLLCWGERPQQGWQ
jgi:hypothetical protein